MVNIGGRDVRVDGRLLRIARLEADKYHFVDDPEPILEGLRKCGKRADLFTFTQRLSEASPRYGYPLEWDNCAVLPVSTYDAWWTQQVNNKTRNAIRKSEKKGVELREVPFDDALVHGIWTIYNECPVRQGRLFPHHGKDITTVWKEAATFLDSSFFIGAFFGGELVGFAKLTIDESRTQAGIMHILSLVQHRDKAATNALIAQAVRSCAEREIHYLLYVRFPYQTHRHGLSAFMVHNGFQRINLPRYYVPLTYTGWIGFRLGLHHRLADRIPEGVRAQVRKLRSAWYCRKNQVLSDAS